MISIYHGDYRQIVRVSCHSNDQEPSLQVISTVEQVIVTVCAHCLKDFHLNVLPELLGYHKQMASIRSEK